MRRKGSVNLSWPCGAVVSVVAIMCFASPSPAAETTVYDSAPEQRAQAIDSMTGGDQHERLLIASALYDEDVVVRRTAIYKLVEIGEPAVDAIRQGLANAQPAVRRIALQGLEKIGQVTTDDLEAAVEDPNEVLRWEATRILLEQEQDDAVEALLEIARYDDSSAVSDMARRALWESQFVASGTSLREQYPERDIQVLDSFNLPATQWRFRLDEDRTGHQRHWYAADYDDSDWDTIDIEDAWGNLGYDYVGVAWYRTTFEMPDETDCDGVEIHFEGVDESGWVWINGEYVGKQDIGPGGWNVPFELDITDAINWGGENRIAVRVMNTAHAGGIFRPVSVRLLDVR